MKKTVTMFIGFLAAGAAAASVVCSGSGAAVGIDTRIGVRVARATEPLAYSTEWNTGTTGVTIAIDGETLFSAAAPVPGDYTWDASSASSGLHTLTFDDGVETLNAQFAVRSYSVVFNANGGSGEMPDQTLGLDISEALNTNLFSRTGYTFAGWAMKEGGAVVYADGAVVSNLSAEAGSIVDLYAIWSSGTYSVHFDANGGEGSMPDQALWLDIPCALNLNAFSQTGLAFVGWATDEWGAVAYADGADVLNLSGTKNAVVTLYARWADARIEAVDGIVWTYTLSDGEATIGSGSWNAPAVPTSTSGAITIPATLGGCPVTGIGDYAFSDCDGLTSVTIPASVTSLGEYIFGDCGNLATIIVDVANPVFDSRDNCNAIIRTADNTLVVGCENSTIPNTVTTIGHDAFSGCDGLMSLTFPPSVTNIMDYAFSWCGFRSVTIPDTVTSIGDGAFYNCSGLESVTIGQGVSHIGESVFSDCYWLETIIVDVANPVYDSRENCDAIIRTADNTLVAGCNSSIIPDSVTAIGDSAFFMCGGLMSVAIPDGVTSIGDYAFCSCSGLMSVVIPDSVTGIGDNAFEDCSNLQSLQLPLRFRENVSSMSIPEGCTVSFHGNLNVVSEHGAPFPGIGANAIEVFNSATVSCHIDGIQNADIPGVRYVCAGWRGTGSVPASGTGTNVTFEIEEDSSITWLWETNVWVECTVSGDAELSGSDGGWFLKDGEAAVFNFAPGHRPFVHALSGDADGVVVDAEAGTVTVPADRPRLVRLIVPTWRDAGEAAGGAPVAWADGTDAKWQLAVDATASDGFCLRSGETVANGTSTVEATFVGPGVLSFNWRISAGRGDFARVYLDGVLQQSITRSTAWATVSLEMRDGGHTVRWRYERGSTSATGEDATLLDEVCWLPLSLSEALDATNIVWMADGAKEWFPQVSVSHDSVDAARSGQVIGDDVSGLETSLVGPGTLSWFWRLDSAGNSGVDVMVDGVWLPAYEPIGEWTEESLEISEGEHTIRFEFWNAGMEATISDCAYIDAVVWTPEAPESIEVDGVEVPVSWLEEYPTLVEEHSGSHEAAANAIAANEINTVWECYVAGLCPTNATDLFRTVISWKCGVPEISWDPELAPEEATKRTYRKYGRKSLTDPNEGWTEVTDGDEGNFNFFKVSVEMK